MYLSFVLNTWQPMLHALIDVLTSLSSGSDDFVQLLGGYFSLFFISGSHLAGPGTVGWQSLPSAHCIHHPPPFWPQNVSVEKSAGGWITSQCVLFIPFFFSLGDPLSVFDPRELESCCLGVHYLGAERPVTFNLCMVGGSLASPWQDSYFLFYEGQLVWRSMAFLLFFPHKQQIFDQEMGTRVSCLSSRSVLLLHNKGKTEDSCPGGPGDWGEEHDDDCGLQISPGAYPRPLETCWNSSHLFFSSLLFTFVSKIL